MYLFFAVLEELSCGHRNPDVLSFVVWGSGHRVTNGWAVVVILFVDGSCALHRFP